MIKKLLLLLFVFPFSMYAQTYIMSSTPISACSGTHLDPQGALNYLDNSSFTQTLCSSGGDCIKLTFTSFGLESGYDFLTVYDGSSTSAAQVSGSPFTGSALPSAITSHTGCLTLVFTSDFSNTDIGWTATISCVACPPPPPPPPPYAWTQKASVPASGRHRGVAVSIGSRGYAGLGHINAVADILYDDWWEYDPGTNTWTQKANFLPGPRMHACAFSIGNYGYVGTGRDNAYVEQNDLYRYDPAMNTWTTMAPMPTTGRRGAVAFVANGKGYVGTGSYSQDFWEYNPSTNSWAAKAPFPGTARISAVAFAVANKGYVGTGDTGGPNTDFYEYNPLTNTWTPIASILGPPRMEAAAFAMGSCGYVGTGADAQSGNNYSDFYQYDPASNSWIQLVDFSGIARRYMSCFAIGMRGYGVFGTSGTNYNDLWEYGNLNDIDDNQFNSIAVSAFPNPFNDKITLRIPDQVVVEQATLRLMNISGQTICVINNINTNELVIERNNLAKGMYFYEMTINKNTKAYGKFIAE